MLLDQQQVRSDGKIYSVDMPLGKMASKIANMPASTAQDWSLLVIAGNRAMETPLAIE